MLLFLVKHLTLTFNLCIVKRISDSCSELYLKKYKYIQMYADVWAYFQGFKKKTTPNENKIEPIKLLKWPLAFLSLAKKVLVLMMYHLFFNFLDVFFMCVEGYVLVSKGYKGRLTIHMHNTLTYTHMHNHRVQTHTHTRTQWLLKSHLKNQIIQIHSAIVSQLRITKKYPSRKNAD